MSTLSDDFREVVYGGGVAFLCFNALKTTEPNMYLDNFVEVVGTLAVLVAVHGASKITKKIYNGMKP